MRSSHTPTLRVAKRHVAWLMAIMLPAASGGWQAVAVLAQTTVQTPIATSSAGLEARARAIGKDLRCVVCQNQSIEESNAPLALDLKQLLRERLTAGDSDAQAIAFLVARYGNFVLLKPPFQLNTLLLWVGQFLLLGAAAWSVRRYFTAAPAALTPELSTDVAKQADQILARSSR